MFVVLGCERAGARAVANDASVVVQSSRDKLFGSWRDVNERGRNVETWLGACQFTDQRHISYLGIAIVLLDISGTLL
jgi:hypothetical protein